jgi:uncharacterized protein (DUF1330 family)
MASVNPTPEQIQALVEHGPEGPIVMVNLLKYRAKAAYDASRSEAKEGLSGREAYQRYGAVAVKHVTASGGGIVWGGTQKLVVVGGPEHEWDDVVCVRYPSRQAFLKMVSDPDYRAAAYHREAGLERTALLCCDAGMAS